MTTVLVVDDEEVNRYLLRTLLQHAGYRVLEAEGGLQALEMAREAEPDLIILDLSLPDVSGAHVLRELRQDCRTFGLRVALYTATAGGPAINELYEAYDVRGTVPKPGDPASILVAVANALATSASRRR